VDRLRRLIDDLLANAVGHSAQGGVVRVEVSETTRPVVTPRSG
jgi:signal transduction histidine kinase